MKRLIILGSGGNCLDILDALLAINQHQGRAVYDCVGFLDDNPELQGTEVAGVRVLGPLKAAARFPDCAFVNGIGSPESYRRKKDILRTTGLDIERFEIILHPLASVSPQARLGEGCVALAGAAVGARAVLGNHVLLLQGSIVSHDCEVGDYTCIASGACLAGSVKVAASSYIGANASVRGGVRIGPGSLVGMGSVVLNSVPENCAVAGNPARVLRQVTR